MRLFFEMSGMPGEPEATLDTEIDVDELPVVEGGALQETIDAIRSGDDAGLDGSTAPEGMTYRLVVGATHQATDTGDDDEAIELIFDERTLPVDLLPLIDVLRDRAIEERIAKNRRE